MHPAKTQNKKKTICKWSGIEITFKLFPTDGVCVTLLCASATAFNRRFLFACLVPGGITLGFTLTTLGTPFGGGGGGSASGCFSGTCTLESTPKRLKAL